LLERYLFFVQHVARAKLVGDVSENLAQKPHSGTKSEIGDAPFCNNAAACAIASRYLESTTPLQGFSALS
jgi:hypothetical protein